MLSDRKEIDVVLKKHAIIVGWNSFAREVVKELVISNVKIAILATNDEEVNDIERTFHNNRKDLFVILSNPQDTNTFRKVNVEEAAIVFLNYGNDTTKLISALNIRGQYAHINVVVVLESPELQDTFHSAGVTYVFSKGELVANLVASHIYEPDVAQYTEDLIATSTSENNYDIQQFLVTDENPFCNSLYGKAFQTLNEEYNILLIGLVKCSFGENVLHKLPADSMQIEEGDYIIAIVNGITSRVLSRMCSTEEGKL